MDKRTRDLICYYCYCVIVILFTLPVCKTTPNGVVIREAGPNKYIGLPEFIKYKSNNLHIDWSLIAIEFLLITFIFICIYLTTQDEVKNNEKDKKKE